MNTQTPTVNANKPTTLAGLVALVESNNNPYAVRLEQSYLDRVKNSDDVASALRISHTTACFLLSCSWGKYQIMGENLWNMGYCFSPISYCNEETIQDCSFESYCITNDCNYTLDMILKNVGLREDFARKYNGPGNADNYSKLLIQTYENSK